MTDKKNQRFTFDSEDDGVEMPTLTSLLYKKNVVKSQTSGGKKSSNPSQGRQAEESRIMTLEPTTTIERPLPPVVEANVEPKQSYGNVPTSAQSTGGEISLSQEPGPALSISRSEFNPSNQKAPIAGALIVKPASSPYCPTTRVRVNDIGTYPSEAFASSALRALFTKPKMNTGVILESADGELFEVKSILKNASGAAKSEIWSGMQFNTKAFADLWGRLQKFGFAEFTTLGAASNGGNDRTAFRAAFQPKANEVLTFVRTKEPSGREALVVLFSEGSIQSLIPGFQSDVLSSRNAQEISIRLSA